MHQNSLLLWQIIRLQMHLNLLPMLLLLLKLLLLQLKLQVNPVLQIEGFKKTIILKMVVQEVMMKIKAMEEETTKTIVTMEMKEQATMEMVIITVEVETIMEEIQTTMVEEGTTTEVETTTMVVEVETTITEVDKTTTEVEMIMVVMTTSTEKKDKMVNSKITKTMKIQLEIENNKRGRFQTLQSVET